MKVIMCVLASALIFATNANKMEVSPVQKVLQLLQGMLEKGKKEKHEEQVMFAASRQFCTDEEGKLVVSIEEEEQTIEGLAALIAKDTADVAHLTKLISLLDKDQDVWSGDIKAATKVREIEAADYQATHKDLDESIDAVGRAITVLKKGTGDRKQAKSFVQLSSMALIPDNAKKALEMFLQQGEEERGAPEANGYESQSSGVIEMLSGLKDKFIQERTDLEKEETNSKHAYQLLMQELKAEIVEAVKDKHSKQLSKTKRLGTKADETQDKKAEEGLEKVDSKSLSDLKATCKMKASDFEARQNLRAGEIEVIEKAIEIISSGSVAGKSDKHLPSFLQGKATSLSQLRSNMASEVKQRLSVFLQAQAAKADSRVLALVAERIKADPFNKVKKMLKDLVVRLMEEANEEAEHKGWCDTELSTNGQTRTEKTTAVENLHSDIDRLTANIAKINEDITDLSKTMADSDSAVAKATKIRNEEKAKNKETVSDAQEAQTATAQALTVLREFYAKAAEAESFAQLSEPYKGMQAENGGVVGMLEVIESDFARLESETTTAEESAKKEYNSMINDAKEDKAEKSTIMEHKTAKLQDLSQELTEKKEDLEGTQKELDAALKYFDKLKPSCVDSGVSYEDRVARRKQEIESMQDALKILNGEDI